MCVHRVRRLASLIYRVLSSGLQTVNIVCMLTLSYCNHECQHAQHITDSYIQLFMHMKCMIISIFLFAHIHAWICDGFCMHVCLYVYVYHTWFYVVHTRRVEPRVSAEQDTRHPHNTLHTQTIQRPAQSTGKIQNSVRGTQWGLPASLRRDPACLGRPNRDAKEVNSERGQRLTPQLRTMWTVYTGNSIDIQVLCYVHNYERS